MRPEGRRASPVAGAAEPAGHPGQPGRADEEQHAPRSGRVLELGCGAGDLSLALAEHGYEVHGVDIAPTAIDFMNARRPLPAACPRTSRPVLRWSSPVFARGSSTWSSTATASIASSAPTALAFWPRSAGAEARRGSPRGHHVRRGDQRRAALHLRPGLSLRSRRGRCGHTLYRPSRGHPERDRGLRLSGARIQGPDREGTSRGTWRACRCGRRLLEPMKGRVAGLLRFREGERGHARSRVPGERGRRHWKFKPPTSPTLHCGSPPAPPILSPSSPPRNTGPSPRGTGAPGRHCRIPPTCNSPRGRAMKHSPHFQRPDAIRTSGAHSL